MTRGVVDAVVQESDQAKSAQSTESTVSDDEMEREIEDALLDGTECTDSEEHEEPHRADHLTLDEIRERLLGDSD